MTQKWFYRLVQSDANSTSTQSWNNNISLTEYYGTEELSQYTVVYFEKQQGTRQYTAFRSHTDYYKFFTSCLPDNRRFHEVIMGNACQKPRFDIDIKSGELPDGVSDIEEFGQLVLDRCISSIIKTLHLVEINISPTNNIAVFTSHGEGKMSYHVIVTGYFHNNCGEAKSFYKEVSSNLEDRDLVNKYIDGGIYSKNHSLRMLWCHKLGSNRDKIFQQTYTYNGASVTYNIEGVVSRDHLNIILLETSLVTFTSGCTILPFYEEVYDGSKQEIVDLEPRHIDMIMSMLNRYTDRVMGCRPFTLMSRSNRLFRLKRNQSSYCEKCDSVHDSMNPYMILIGNKLYFHCARAEKHKRVELGNFNHNIGTVSESWIVSMNKKLLGTDQDFTITYLDNQVANIPTVEAISGQPVNLNGPSIHQQPVNLNGPSIHQQPVNLNGPSIHQQPVELDRLSLVRKLASTSWKPNGRSKKSKSNSWKPSQEDVDDTSKSSWSSDFTMPSIMF